MYTTIVIELPDDALHFVDSEVSRGTANDRAEFVQQVLERLQRERGMAEGDLN